MGLPGAPFPQLALHLTQVTWHLEHHTYNVAIAELMTFFNQLKRFRSEFLGSSIYHEGLLTLCILLAPMAPHITSELWERLSDAGESLGAVKHKVSIQW